MNFKLISLTSYPINDEFYAFFAMIQYINNIIIAIHCILCNVPCFVLLREMFNAQDLITQQSRYENKNIHLSIATNLILNI